MILILSNIANEAAAPLGKRFPAGTASLVTASAFQESFRAGISVNNFSVSEIMTNTISVATRDITGVIATIPCFLPQEFYYIEPADRSYVCTEMNAFFIYFLAELTCKKINPPSPRTLTGLNLHRIEWMKTAHRLNIPVWPVRLKNGMAVDTEDRAGCSYLRCTAIGTRVTGDAVPEKITATVRLLSQVFSLPYLTCYFVKTDEKDYFLSEVLSVPDISSAENQDAIVHYFIK